MPDPEERIELVELIETVELLQNEDVPLTEILTEGEAGGEKEDPIVIESRDEAVDDCEVEAQLYTVAVDRMVLTNAAELHAVAVEEKLDDTVLDEVAKTEGDTEKDAVLEVV